MTMSNVRKAALGSVSAIALAASFASAQAATEVYGGGATLPSVVARELFNCFGQVVDTNGTFISPQCSAPVGFNAFFGYAAVGSSGGQRPWATNNPNRMGTPSGSQLVPYATNSGPVPNNPPLPAGTLEFDIVAPTGGYAGGHLFSLSEATLIDTGEQSEECYLGIDPDPDCNFRPGGAVTLGGPAIQIPFLVTTVNVAFNIPTGDPLAPRLTSLNLSRDAVCGIFTKNITQWDDPLITADQTTSVRILLDRLDNPAFFPALGGNDEIKVVVRRDGSGTSFLFSQGLTEQCDTSAFPFSGGTQTSPDWVGASATAGGRIYSRDGNAGVASLIAEEPLTIGYISPDFSRPTVLTNEIPAVDPDLPSLNDLAGGNPVAIAAGVYDAGYIAAVANSTGAFRLPSATFAQAALNDSIQPFDILSVDQWSLNGNIGDPAGADAYPFVGFNWLLLYTCYEERDVANAINNYLLWHYQSKDARRIIQSRGFATVPGRWLNAIEDLLVNTPERKIGRGGAGVNCSAFPGVPGGVL